MLVNLGLRNFSARVRASRMLQTARPSRQETNSREQSQPTVIMSMTRKQNQPIGKTMTNFHRRGFFQAAACRCVHLLLLLAASSSASGSYHSDGLPVGNYGDFTSAHYRHNHGNLNDTSEPKVKRAVQFQNDMTDTLNSLLLRYDSRLRPNFGGPPTEVGVFMNIRSMGPISEEDMSYSVDAYLRQTWVDERLQFESVSDEELPMHISILNGIWKPDTFFHNGKMSYVHSITAPNKLIRISGNGSILFSMRLSIKASCPMNLIDFPLDDQLCSLRIGSYAYTNDEVRYTWKYGEHSLKLHKDMAISQFHLRDQTLWSDNSSGRAGVFSTIGIDFDLQRHMGYFLIHVYLPSVLIVMASWVTFWINREATGDRIGLGVTAVLTLTTLDLQTRDNLPPLSYATALDSYVLTCFSFIIATLLEFAIVHYFTKLGSGDWSSDDDDEYTEDGGSSSSGQPVVVDFTPVVYQDLFSDSLFGRASFKRTPNLSRAQKSGESTETKSCSQRLLDCLNCLQGNHKHREYMMAKSKMGFNSVSKIDIFSRIFFPASFVVFNVIYWLVYI